LVSRIQDPGIEAVAIEKISSGVESAHEFLVTLSIFTGKPMK